MQYDCLWKYSGQTPRMPSPSSLSARLSWIYRAWRYRLKVERPEIACLLHRLAPGDTVVDIGAHKGAYTYWMHRAVGADGAVFAFEPQPTLAHRLEALVTASKYSNVTVENLGLSSTTGTLMLKLPHADGSPSASFENTAFTSHDSLEISVLVSTLDAYFLDRDAASGKRIAFIKCDAEGHELEVFRGGRRLLSEHGPDLLFECEARHRDGSVEAVFAFLHELGYEGRLLSRSGESPVADFDAKVHQADPESDDYVNNFLFTRPGREGH